MRPTIMKASDTWLASQPPTAFATQAPTALATIQGRRQLVAFAVTLSENTGLAPGSHEQQLLTQFVAGEISLEQLAASVEAPAAE